MSTSQNITLALIDENPRTRWEIVAALLGVGLTAKVISIENQQSAREVLSGEERIDLIIADPFAFLGHGVEIIATIRTHSAGKHLPLLIYSSCGKKNWGGAVCVPKPAHSVQLAGAILRCLPRGRLSMLSPLAARAIALSSPTS
ncbi:MAG TPA: hypothetical protein VJ579_00475 [Candidatus Paceibacterota bacterium]|nr:hypothetical protein [Candidatus Paceibacterota bacterium]